MALVGGKNASLGEMFNQLKDKGISVPDGFATTAAAYGLFLDENRLREPLTELLASLDTKEFTNLPGARQPGPVAGAWGHAARARGHGHPRSLPPAAGRLRG